MSVGCLVLATSIVDTEWPLPIGGAPKLTKKTVLPSGVTAIEPGPGSTVMSSGFFVLVFTSIVDTAPARPLTTKAVLPSGVTATPVTFELTGISVGFLVLVF